MTMREPMEPGPAVASAARRWPWLLTAPTFDGLVRRRASVTPDAVMLVDAQGDSLSWAEFDRRTSGVARALAAQGIGPGTRVAWQLPTRISTALVMAALRRLGAVQAPLVPLYRDRELTAALATAEAEFFLVPGIWRGVDYVALAGTVARVLSAAGRTAPRVLDIGHHAPEAHDTTATGADVTAFPPPDPDGVAWIHFTSGSTGPPKGARHSDTSLLVPGLSFAGIGELGRKSGEFGAMGFPIAHVGGVQYLIAALAAGFPLLLLEAFTPGEAVELFRRHGVTTTGGAPPFYTMLVEQARGDPGTRPVPTLRSVKGGGAPCPPHLVGEVADALGAVLAHDYGMTEVPMIAVASPSDAPAVLAATDGRPLPDNQLRLVAADGAGAPPGTVGEVQVRGPGVCHGYTDPEATAAAFTPDGWFRTGDLGFLHDTGHVEVVGRVEDLVIREGEKIVPLEIETLLVNHPDVAEAAVVGLPDTDRGERVCAVVVVKPGRRAPTVVELGEWLTDAGLTRQKHPEQVEVVDALPRTGPLKVAKSQLRRRFAPVG
ncbi:AMP-binding protein [Streptomyces sp. SID4956]|uniref:AMP-binding protein n=1 Tax=Streptomyces sp. SID4956 TaxID=2690290 RepID=UPI0013711F9D|nr:AMP-binding protein [Streptomyces sp. SID4956]